MTVWFKGFSAVGNVFGNRWESDWRSRGREFDPGPVPYFRGDWLWNNFYGHSPPFRWIIQEALLSVSSERMYTKYWLTACSSLPRKSVVDLGRKATTQTNKYPPPPTHTHTHSKAHVHLPLQSARTSANSVESSNCCGLSRMLPLCQLKPLLTSVVCC